ncbi:MAG: phosphoglucosamine mutase [Desulfobacterales bacterium]|nr:phosphoglucosamine mutase [Desulfobacterales bacterium]
MGKLFGTDGIRGKANIYPMDAETALTVGRAFTLFLKNKVDKPQIIIGMDTRISGQMIAASVAAGVCSVGGDVILTGILPTPAVARLTISLNADAGIVISASHNTFFDNGIKLFLSDGTKLSDKQEAAIEEMVFNKNFEAECSSIQETGIIQYQAGPDVEYKEFLKKAIGSDFNLDGMKVVLDCSNGAASAIAPDLFREFGADVHSIFDTPDGRNINHQCGSQHPEVLSAVVKEKHADIGLAFDGDADRLIAVDERGQILTGDQLVVIGAKFLKDNGKLINNTVATTIMSNLGLSEALEKMGIQHKVSGVGDRKVMQEMLSAGAVLGGEDSGHIIYLNEHTTGDGIFAGLKLLAAINSEKKPLSELKKIMTVYPQVLINVDIKKKIDVNDVPEIKNKINTIEKNLGKRGRVLVRYSGTQPVCRIMVEGPTIEETQKYCQQIADCVKNNIG